MKTETLRDPVKLQIKRQLNSVVLMICIVASVFFVNVALNHFLSSYYESRIDQQQLQTRLVQDIKFRFKVQVQEWKNVLLRGHNRYEFSKYYAAFTKEHESIQEHGEKLVRETRDNFFIRAKTEKFISEHNKLYEQYNHALREFDQKIVGSAFDVDLLVRGIDRSPTELLSNLENEIQKNVSIKIGELLEQRKWAELALSISAAIVVLLLMHKLLQFAKQSSKKMYSHTVTGAYNKAALYLSFEDVILAERPIRLLLADIDHFKTINEAKGVISADMLLRELVKFFQADTSIRLFHLSSNLFVIIPISQELESSEFIRLIRSRIDYFNQYNNEQGPHLSFTTCFCDFDTKGVGADDLFNRCSAAMQESKSSGKGQHHDYCLLKDKIENRQTVMRSSLSIEQFIYQEKLILFGQAIVSNHATVSIPKYEVLLRVDDNGQLKSPFVLLEAAEAYDKSYVIDKYVIDEVFVRLKTERTKCHYSVNLSAKSLQHQSFISYLINKVASDRPLANSLTFELTETAVVSNMDIVKDLFVTLRGFGCKIAIDDFGVGESSLRYLMELSVDIVKIDGYFIRQIENSATAKSLVEAIVSICQGLNIETVAEFVESEPIQQEVKNIGITYSQGFGIHKPEDLKACN